MEKEKERERNGKLKREGKIYIYYILLFQRVAIHKLIFLLHIDVFVPFKKYIC